MDEMTILGYVISALITVGALFGILQKFTAPINLLNVSIQKLSDKIDMLVNDGKRRDDLIKKIEDKQERLESELQDVKRDVDNIKLKVNMYHKE